MVNTSRQTCSMRPTRHKDGRIKHFGMRLLHEQYLDWTPFMETDFCNILFTHVPSYIRYDALRVLPILLGELGGRHVFQGRVDSIVVVVFKCGK